jgi:uncharacterized protein (TIGR04255 family)
MVDPAHKERITFARPPVDETILSIQFDTLTGFKSQHVGLFWNRIRDAFPSVTEQPPLQPVFETFGVSPHRGAIRGLRFEIGPAAFVGRFWFEGKSPHDLVQIQQDRIIRNWRRQSRDDVYPRYETVRTNLGDDVENFTKFLRDEEIGDISPNQCEVTYINIIDATDDAKNERSLSQVLSLWTESTTTPLPGALEDCSIGARFLLEESGQPFGRVNINCIPAMTMEGARVFRLEVTGRAKPRGQTIAGAFQMLDDLHVAAVRTFAAITTKEMHEVWGLQNVK